MTHNDLINEVTRQLATRFQPNPQDIKRRIETLIDVGPSDPVWHTTIDLWFSESTWNAVMTANHTNTWYVAGSALGSMIRLTLACNAKA